MSSPMDKCKVKLKVKSLKKRRIEQGEGSGGLIFPFQTQQAIPGVTQFPGVIFTSQEQRQKFIDLMARKVITHIVSNSCAFQPKSIIAHPLSTITLKTNIVCSRLITHIASRLPHLQFCDPNSIAPSTLIFLTFLKNAHDVQTQCTTAAESNTFGSLTKTPTMFWSPYPMSNLTLVSPTNPIIAFNMSSPDPSFFT